MCTSFEIVSEMLKHTFEDLVAMITPKKTGCKNQDVKMLENEKTLKVRICP